MFICRTSDIFVKHKLYALKGLWATPSAPPLLPSFSVSCAEGLTSNQKPERAGPGHRGWWLISPTLGAGHCPSFPEVSQLSPDSLAWPWRGPQPPSRRLRSRDKAVGPCSGSLRLSGVPVLSACLGSGHSLPQTPANPPSGHTSLPDLLLLVRGKCLTLVNSLSQIMQERHHCPQAVWPSSLFWT